MANSLLTINMITREAIRLFKNSNAFIQEIDHQYDDSFAQTGAKIGSSLRIRYPNDFTVTTGPAASVQDTAEQNTTLVLATQMHVDVSYSMADRTLSLDDFSRRVLAPMVNVLAGGVALTIMSGVEGGICNFVANVDSSNNVLSPTASTWLQAGAALDVNSAPMAVRKIIIDPVTEARTVASLSGLLNPAQTIGEQYKLGKMRDALGFEWFKDQTVLKHSTAAYGASMTVNGAGQQGTNLVVNALNGPLNAGDIITIAGVNAINRITKQSLEQLRQFVVTENVPTGATLVPIYPAIIPYALVDGTQVQVQYQTVDSSPANGAAINVVTNASSVYRKNLAFVPDAVTMATADLEMPRGVHEVAREQFDGISMRMVSAYNIQTDQLITRLDVLFGYQWLRPEWAVVVADAI